MSNELQKYAKWSDIDPTTGKTYSQLWQDGWQHGYDDGIANKEWPEEFVHRGAIHWRGYAEGRISANSKLKYE